MSNWDIHVQAVLIQQARVVAYLDIVRAALFTLLVGVAAVWLYLSPKKGISSDDGRASLVSILVLAIIVGTIGLLVNAFSAADILANPYYWALCNPVK